MQNESIDQTALESGVCVHSTVAQKWPMRPMFVNALPIEFRGKDLLSINRTLGNDFAVRPANKALAPEFNPIAAGRRFVADAIGRCDVTAVRHRVTALDQLPRRMLRFTEFFFFFRM